MLPLPVDMLTAFQPAVSVRELAALLPNHVCLAQLVLRAVTTQITPKLHTPLISIAPLLNCTCVGAPEQR